MPIIRPAGSEQAQLHTDIPPDIWGSFDLYRQLHGGVAYPEHTRRAMAIYNEVLRAEYAGGGVFALVDDERRPVPVVKQEFDRGDTDEWYRLSININEPYRQAVETIQITEGLSEDDIALSSIKNYVDLLDRRSKDEHLIIAKGDGYDYEFRLLV